MSTPSALLAPAHPWRRTARTGLAVLLAVLPLLPVIVDSLGLDRTLPVVAGLLTLAAGATRLLALPQVEQLLRRFAPWLSAGDVASSDVLAQVFDGQVVAGDAHPAPTGRVLARDETAVLVASEEAAS